MQFIKTFYSDGVFWHRRATENEDYVPTQGIVSFVDGQERANVTVQLIDDAIPETEESVFIYIVSVTLIEPLSQGQVSEDWEKNKEIFTNIYRQVPVRTMWTQCIVLPVTHRSARRMLLS